MRGGVTVLNKKRKENTKDDYAENEKRILDITITDDFEAVIDEKQSDTQNTPEYIEELAKILKPDNISYNETDTADSCNKSSKAKTAKIIITVVIAAILLAALILTVYYIIASKDKRAENIVDNSLVTDFVEISSSLQTSADADYNKNEYIPDLEKYTDTILSPTADAGVGYLDETLFIGDSNTQRMYVYGYFPLQNIIAAEGMGIESVSEEKFVYFSGMAEPVTVAKAVSYLQPRRIIFNFGTNNASGNMSADDFIAYYKAALDEIKSEYPFCDIILAAIYPVAQQRTYNNISLKTIDEFNLAILNFAQQEGYKFLNTPEILKDERTGYIKEKYVIEDGLHLNSNAYDDILDYIRTHALITPDIRPALTAVPQRCLPPILPEIEETDESNAVTVSVSFTAQTQYDGTVVDEQGGSVSGNLVQKLTLGETGTEVSAQANSGYVFCGWYIGTVLISEQPQIAYTVPADVTQSEYVIKAVFMKLSNDNSSS